MTCDALNIRLAMQDKKNLRYCKFQKIRDLQELTTNVQAYAVCMYVCGCRWYRMYVSSTLLIWCLKRENFYQETAIKLFIIFLTMTICFFSNEVLETES